MNHFMTTISRDLLDLIWECIRNNQYSISQQMSNKIYNFKFFHSDNKIEYIRVYYDPNEPEIQPYTITIDNFGVYFRDEDLCRRTTEMMQQLLVISKLRKGWR